jgi:hypothetical protein
MTLGTGIFLAAIVMSLTALFIATKDRWNWKKIALVALGLFVVAPALGLLGIFVYDRQESDPAPKPTTSYWGIEFDVSADDVVFLKGQPKEKKDDTWTYNVDDGLYNYEVLIGFKNGRVTFVSALGASIPYDLRLHGLGLGSPVSEVVAKLGTPQNPKKAAVEGYRVYEYEALNTFYVLAEGKVTQLGISQGNGELEGGNPPEKRGK